MKEEIMDNSSSVLLESMAMPSSPPDNRRTSIRQQKRRTFPTPKDSSISPKKRTRFDFENNSNFQTDNINNSDHSLSPLESLESRKKFYDEMSDEFCGVLGKRCRTVGKRSAKRTVNQAGRFGDFN